MVKYVLLSILLSTAQALHSQVPVHDYFSPSLCQAEDVKLVTVYETKIDDPVAKAGQGNRIRLAKNIVRQLYFDPNGYRSRMLRLSRGGDVVQQEVTYVYDSRGLELSESLRLFHTNYADSTKLIQRRETLYGYDGKGHLFYQSNYLVASDNREMEDSTAIHRDALGRTQLEQVYGFDSKPSLQLEKTYTYTSRNITMVTKLKGQEGNREEYELDDQGRKVHEWNFAPGETQARLETTYSYDPRGWLQEIRYQPDWRYFKRDETVVSRINKFDDHGKLVEAQMDYGSGKRLIEFYDYSYWAED